jgi:hypothetical protein
MATRGKEKIITVLFWLSALVITAILAGIIGYIVVKGYPR